MKQDFIQKGLLSLVDNTEAVCRPVVLEAYVSVVVMVSRGSDEPLVSVAVVDVSGHRGQHEQLFVNYLIQAVPLL